MTDNAIVKEIVAAAFRIHTTLGPGLLESVYPKSGSSVLNAPSFRGCLQ